MKDLPKGYFKLGNHIYKICEYCGKVVRMTGFLARWHFCSEANPEVKKMNLSKSQEPK